MTDDARLTMHANELQANPAFMKILEDMKADQIRAFQACPMGDDEARFRFQTILNLCDDFAARLKRYADAGKFEPAETPAEEKARKRWAYF
jgi:hypothetical protein